MQEVRVGAAAVLASMQRQQNILGGRYAHSSRRYSSPKLLPVFAKPWAATVALLRDYHQDSGLKVLYQVDSPM